MMFEEMNEPYACDIELIKKLGLEHFRIKNHVVQTLGVVNFEDKSSSVKVSVECIPAQIWMFKVYNGQNGKTYQVKTGSGTLSSYWNSIELLATDMIVVDEI